MTPIWTPADFTETVHAANADHMLAELARWLEEQTGGAQ